MLQSLLDLYARLPMWWFHRSGYLAGWLTYWFARVESGHWRNNLRLSGAFSNEDEYRTLLKKSIYETGKTAVEWIKIWFAPRAEIERSIVACDGWNLIEEAHRDAKPIIFLMPHLGSIHMVMVYLGKRLPVTVLYRPPSVRWLEPYALEGGKRAGLSMAPTDLKGVEALLQALRRGEAIVLPPDQAPNSRGGVWADFFGRPAYTSTLPRKIQRATGATLISVFAERLPNAKGFHLHFEAVPSENFDETELNRPIERLVLRCPSQYFWSYNRYKVPRQSKWPWRKKLLRRRSE